MYYDIRTSGAVFYSDFPYTDLILKGNLRLTVSGRVVHYDTRTSGAVFHSDTRSPGAVFHSETGSPGAVFHSNTRSPGAVFHSDSRDPCVVFCCDVPYTHPIMKAEVCATMLTDIINMI